MKFEELLDYKQLEGHTVLPENLILAFWDSIFGRDGTEVNLPKVLMQKKISTWTWPFNGMNYEVFMTYLHGPRNMGNNPNIEHKNQSVVVKDGSGKIVLNLHMFREPSGDEVTLFKYQWQGQTSFSPKQIMYWKLQKK